jgi:hypothetical protein
MSMNKLFHEAHKTGISEHTGYMSSSIALINKRQSQDTNTGITSDAICVLMLADVAPASRLWGYSRFVVGRFALRSIAGLRFYKVLGSGYEGGFGLKPSGTRQGLFLLFDSAQQADDFLHQHPLSAAYQAKAQEFFSVKLRPYSSRGTWAGVSLPITTQAPAQGVVASLTRASIRMQAALDFWRKQPAAEQALAKAQGCLLATGVGEAPLLRQATFTLWESTAAMDAYARQGAHLEAIKASHAGQHFAESMFTRFVPEDAKGVYKGVRYG